MLCVECPTGICVVVNLAKKYEPMLAKIQEELLLPQTELGILHTPHAEAEPERPVFVAAELDVRIDWWESAQWALKKEGWSNGLEMNKIIEFSKLPR